MYLKSNLIRFVMFFIGDSMNTRIVESFHRAVKSINTLFNNDTHKILIKKLYSVYLA